MVTTVSEIKDIVNRNLIRLEGFTQTYDWGKQGSESLIAQFGPNALGKGFQLNQHSHYAEVWMGTHQHGPARAWYDPEMALQRFIQWDARHFLGEETLRKFPKSTQVPYLFKVLSIAKALPLQVHPDKRLAEDLHWKDPKAFADANYKPEIAIAIGEPIEDGLWGEGVAFTGFVGFQPLEQIVANLKSVPELGRAIGDTDIVEKFLRDPQKSTLKTLYSTLLSRPQSEIAPHVRSLVVRLRSGHGNDDAIHQELARLVIKINDQYPSDVGVLATVFFLNFLKLRFGEAVYIGADEIHAYLEGDIIECMASSDNVINTAFVPPEQHQVGRFIEALTFTARETDHWRLGRQVYPKSHTGATQMYAPPLEEFTVLHTTLGEGAEAEVLEAVKGPVTGIVTKGKVRIGVSDEEKEELGPGGIVYVTPGHGIRVDQLDKDSEVWWAALV